MGADDSFRSVLARRRTSRRFERMILPGDRFEELVWAAFGHTHDYKSIKMRTAPSAGATYPVEMFFVIEDIDGYPDGIYYYDPERDRLARTCQGKFLEHVQRAALDQDFITQANIAAFMVYNPKKIEPNYGKESLKYALLECGHIAQNLLLMASALGLGAVPVGAFDGREIDGIIGLDQTMSTQYMVSVGTIKES